MSLDSSYFARQNSRRPRRSCSANKMKHRSSSESHRRRRSGIVEGMIDTIRTAVDIVWEALQPAGMKAPRVGRQRYLHAESLELRRVLASGVPGGPVFDLDSELGLIVEGGFVSQWQDQAANGNDLLAAGSMRPALVAGLTPTGRAAVRFDGVDDRLLRHLTTGDGIGGLPAGNADRTMFVVAQFHDANAWGGVGYGAGVANQTYGLGVVGSGDAKGKLMLQGWGGGNDLLADELAFGTSGTNGWKVVSAVHQNDGSNSAENSFLYQNGVEIAAWNHEFNTDLTNLNELDGGTRSRISLGEEIMNLGHQRVDIAAVVIYDHALSDSDRQEVETYLQHRYMTGIAPDAPPVITTPAAVTVVAGQTAVVRLTAFDPNLDPLTFAISGGADQSLFQLSGANHEDLSFIVAPNFENPQDANADNIYELTVSAFDGTHTVTLAMTVTLTHSHYGFSDEPFINTGLNQPMSMAFLPDGRMLIVEKVGRVWIADTNSGAKSEYVNLLDIDAAQERGLLDIALAPNFDPASPGPDYIYLYYTPASGQRAQISRFTHQENSGGLTSTASVGSEFAVWHDTETYVSCCHYGGGLDFGPDGKLWLTTGDKFTAPNSG